MSQTTRNLQGPNSLLVNPVPSQIRSRIMASVKGRHTLPELRVRRILHALGFRFRLHRKGLPGSPDIVLRKYKIAIFVHGCFWHRHEACRYATIPRTNRQYWLAKFSKNTFRDQVALEMTHKAGWRTLIVWECALKGAFDSEGLRRSLFESIKNAEQHTEIPLQL